MKPILKKLLKTLLVLITSIVIIYLAFTIPAFCSWCNENQIFVNPEKLFEELDSEKIQALGDKVGNYAQMLEDSLNEEHAAGEQVLAQYYNPLGLSVWSHMRMGIEYVVTKNIAISILSGIAVAIAYFVITTKKMSNILKVTIGYVGVILVFPPIYVYSYTYRFWSIPETYISMAPKIFYIGYTAIFIVMFVINYIVGVKMTKELNQTIKK